MKMRSNILISLGTMAAMLAATACSSDGDDGNRPVPIVLTSTIGTTPTSRAAHSGLQSTQIAAGNGNVGVWIVEDTGTEAPVCENHAYSADGSGKLSTSTPQYFPIDGTLVNVYAYAPRQESGIGLTSGTFTVPSEQTSNDAYIAADLLIGAPLNNHINMGQPVVNISFSHKMAKIVLDFSAVATDEIKGAEITTCDLFNSVAYNIKTAQVTTDEAGTKAKIESQVTDDKKAVFLLPEQKVASGVKLFSMKLSGTTIHYVTPAEITFESGRVYTYNMKVSTTGELVATSADINGWGSGTSGEGQVTLP